MASAAGAASLDYDTGGLERVDGSATVAGERMLRTVCADCKFDRVEDSRPHAADARLGSVASSYASRTVGRREKLPTAAGWSSFSLPPPPDEEVAMTLGVAMLDEQNVQLDTVSQNRALRFPSKRLLAGVRVKLRPAE